MPPLYRLNVELANGDYGSLCTFEEMAGFYDSTSEEQGMRRVDVLISSYLPGHLMARALPAPGSRSEDVTELEVLGRDGTVLGRYVFFISRTERTPEGLSCSAFIAGHGPLPEEEEIWELHRSGPLAKPNLWSRFDRRGRRAWTQVALRRHDRAIRRSGTVFELDGTHVTESAGFFCALGEAINGPGGYYGIGLDSLSDCMSGGFGTSGRFTLIWNDFQVARRGWTLQEPPVPSLDETLALLRSEAATVELR
ncbi:barstar family protein [Spirillospora sp. NPDC050679]